MKRLWILTAVAKSVVAVLLSAFIIPAAQAEPSVALSWQPSAKRMDGTPLAQSEISEYRVYHAVDDPAGIVAGQSYVSVTSGSTTTFDLQLTPRLELYTVYFSVTAVDSGGLESDLSPIVSTRFNVDSTANPEPPSSITFDIQCGDTCRVRLTDDGI